MFTKQLKFKLYSICLIAIACAITIEYWRHQEAIATERDQVAKQLDKHRAKLENIVFRNLSIAHGVANHISFNDQLSQAEFADYAKQQLTFANQISHFAAAKDLIISHIYPMTGNENALGLNYKKTPAQFGDIKKAISSKEVVVTDIVNLVQGGRAIIARYPVFNASTGELWGVLSPVIIFDRLLESAEFTTSTSLDLLLRDVSQESDHKSILWGNERILANTPVHQNTYFANNQWMISAIPKAGWQGYQPNWLVFFSIFALSVIWIRVIYSHYLFEHRHKQLIKEKLSSETKFRSMFEEHKSIMLLINADTGHIVDCNYSAESFFDYTRTKLLALNIDDLTTTANALAQLKQFSKKDAPEIKNQTLIIPSRLANEKIKLVEVDATLISYDQQQLIFAIMSDITQRSATENKLQLASQVFEHSHEGIIITDATPTIISVNKAFEQITGYSDRELIGQNPIALFIKDNDKKVLEKILNELSQHGYWTGEVWSRNKEGKTLPRLVSITEVRDKPGSLLNYIFLCSDISELKASEQKLDQLAHYDHLTSLPNRLMLKKYINEEIDTVKSPMALLFLDLDQFKSINDSLGHKAGDLLLQLASARIQHVISQNDTLARLAGDEFVILLRNINSVKAIETIARRIIKSISKPFTIGTVEEVYIGVSIGISRSPDDACNTDKLIEYADAAMYQAKQHGKNTHYFFDSNIIADAEHKLRIATELRKAIRQDELMLYFQPQFNATKKEVFGAEGLIRWMHPQQGLLSPAVFLPIAEEQGLIKEISNWVLERGIKTLASWQQAGYKTIMSLNISATDLDDQLFSQRLLQLISKYQIVPQYLELEITENTLIENTELVIKQLEKLREYGIRIAIDDFGTGHSSLKYLKHLPVDRLKIDKCFVDMITENDTDYRIVSVIITMANILNIDVIAEGVEQQAQADTLQNIGCDFIQGYLINKPLAEQAFVEQYLTNTNYQSASS